ncbi:WbqC family protein [Aeromonas hydrophila]|uniref:WbqC family protein n=1 Tax=Aeromonas hydrophila TaxID=644 RepID=UPI003D1D05EA|nr:WbqC family protein [Aeromonas hydrophila]
MKKVAILQSNYIPWRGYFDIIASVDEFVLYDDMQFTKRDWRNRNKIKTPQGPQWVTVPVIVKGRYEQKIKDTVIDGVSWADVHYKYFFQNYKRAAYFDDVMNLLYPFYIDKKFTHISQLNKSIIEAICKYLDISTKISTSMDYNLVDGKTERLVDLCQKVGAEEYVSGPSARCYIDSKVFEDAGIGIKWFDYEGYREYPQLWGAFEPHVSIVDLLFNCGPSSVSYMKYT